MSYLYKIIKSGIYTRVYVYNSVQYKTEKDSANPQSVAESTIHREEEKNDTTYIRFSSSLLRAKNNLIWLIDSNITDNSKFLTLTFKDNISDFVYCNNCFENFLLNFKRKFNYKLKYLAVREFQKRGAIHYHLVIFNNDYIDINLLKECWKYGFIKLNKIDSPFNISMYISKYLTKSLANTRSITDYKGLKAYSCSRDLIKPKIQYLFYYDLNNDLNTKELHYSNEYYLSDLDRTKVSFYEFKENL